MSLSEPQRRAVAEQVAARRTRAQDRVEQLERDLEQLIEATAASPDDEHDPEGATIGFERAQAASLLAAARAQLAALEQVRVDLDAGVTDHCAACGRPIGFERLLARPTARTCIACADRGAEGRM